MKQSIEHLKGYFQAGNVPTQTSFGNLIDSFGHWDDIANLSKTGSYDDIPNAPMTLEIPIVAKSTITVPIDGQIIFNSEDNYGIYIYQTDKWCKATLSAFTIGETQVGENHLT
ncbi:hypothetical protein KORDIASMS9_02665 [Kordia sp. SMS9]|uniref:hypothetical protein n=1 Tax=Kordia sp. SMS9 TaxID=2282170 RepID=UPI000E0D3644|nr:hypothetical protein [Kordia sp. SMS9]AXG70425.1 hypothetical protein KORDIASMS9_02665 [Kordia sp. SMS9]